VKSEIAKGAFAIAGGKLGQKVSWQITGIRRDAWAEAHRIPVEEAKPTAQRGLYLHPVEHGQPKGKSLSAAQAARLLETAGKAKGPNLQ